MTTTPTFFSDDFLVDIPEPIALKPNEVHSNESVIDSFLTMNNSIACYYLHEGMPRGFTVAGWTGPNIKVFIELLRNVIVQMLNTDEHISMRFAVFHACIVYTAHTLASSRMIFSTEICKMLVASSMEESMKKLFEQQQQSEQSIQGYLLDEMQVRSTPVISEYFLTRTSISLSKNFDNINILFAGFINWLSSSTFPSTVNNLLMVIARYWFVYIAFQHPFHLERYSLHSIMFAFFGGCLSYTWPDKSIALMVTKFNQFMSRNFQDEVACWREVAHQLPNTNNMQSAVAPVIFGQFRLSDDRALEATAVSIVSYNLCIEKGDTGKPLDKKKMTFCSKCKLPFIEVCAYCLVKK